MARMLTEPVSRALILESPHSNLDQHLAEIGIHSSRLNQVESEADLIAEINKTQAQLVFKRSRVPISRNLVESCPSLFGVQLCCIGSDSVDLEACADLGIMVFNDPISNGRSVVELTIGHLIALSRRLYETDVSTRSGLWQKTEQGRFEVQGKRLGLVGLGNIGRAVARAASQFGIEVQFYDNRPVAQEVGEEMGWERCEDLGALMARSDFVSVHTSAKDAWGKTNANLLNDYLHLLGDERPKSSPRIFLNLARGNLHTTQALLDAVSSGAIRRAAVDVYPEEPRPGQAQWSNPYAAEPRIVCTPHIGAATQEAQPRIARRVATTIEGFTRYGTMRDCVFAPRAKMGVRDYAAGRTVLAVMHSVSRGTKKAVDDAIFEAGCNNLGSVHRDFSSGVAYDLSVLDRPLSIHEIELLIERAAELSDDQNAVRTVRQMLIPG
jgi:D-3-phosphoglycerate dehydrogenase / 2-oxoglutarate reductase